MKTIANLRRSQQEIDPVEWMRDVIDGFDCLAQPGWVLRNCPDQDTRQEVSDILQKALEIAEDSEYKDEEAIVLKLMLLLKLMPREKRLRLAQILLEKPNPPHDDYNVITLYVELLAEVKKKGNLIPGWEIVDGLIEKYKVLCPERAEIIDLQLKCGTASFPYD